MDRSIEQRWWTRRRAVGIAAALLGIAAVAFGYARYGTARTLTLSRDRIVLSTVEGGDFLEYIPVTGTVQPRETVYLDAVDGGQVAEVDVEEGAYVKAGQPLVRLDGLMGTALPALMRNPTVVITTSLFGSGVDPETLRAELERSPYIRSVTTADSVPWSAGCCWLFNLVPSPDSAQHQIRVAANRVGYDFFETVGLKLLAGRVFDRNRDDVADPGRPFIRGGELKVIIDRSLAAKFGWHDPAEAVGKTVYRPALCGGTTPRQIIELLLLDFATPVAIANLIAWPFGWLAAHAYLNQFLARIDLTPVAFIASLVATVAAVAIACIAVGGQALRASRIEPAAVLRYQ